MKFTLILAALLLSQASFAQSAKEKRIKKEMIDRTELLLEKAEGAREDLDHEDVVSACKKIKEMFVLYPDHLKAIGGHLDLERSKSIKAKDDALNQLIFMHKSSLLCDQGKDSEYVDAKKLRKELKETVSTLEKQKKVIKKNDTDHENSFYYEYEF